MERTFHDLSLESMEARMQTLRNHIDAAELELLSLRSQLREAEFAFQVKAYGKLPEGKDWAGNSSPHDIDIDTMLSDSHTTVRTPVFSTAPSIPRWPLTSDEYRRYGRQLILPEMGLKGQMQLKQAKVLIIGVGGLGCPAAAYLAGAGVGTLGLMDGDVVELSNLHRQIAHATTRVGMGKVDSAAEYIESLNPLVRCVRHRSHLSSDMAISIFEQYDLVLDCTDHPTSRYLISDACVLTGKPLVSASALKTEGQLIVLNNPPRPPGNISGGPCYRCIFPKPPPADSVLSCSEGGILGPVVGVMGVLQALEAIKLLASQSMPLDAGNEVRNGDQEEMPKPSLLMFSAYSSTSFRTVRLRSRRKDCAACSSRASIARQSLTSGSLDYLAFCGDTMPINILSPESRISATDFAKLHPDASKLLIDVRDETQFAICALPHSVSVPWTGETNSWLSNAEDAGVLAHNGSEKYVLCRVGNDSQLAVKAMLDVHGSSAIIKDIRGGLQAWRREVDGEWPEY